MARLRARLIYLFSALCTLSLILSVYVLQHRSRQEAAREAGREAGQEAGREAGQEVAATSKSPSIPQNERLRRIVTERTKLLVAKASLTRPSPSEGPKREQIRIATWKPAIHENTTQRSGLPQWLKQKFPHYMIIGFGKAGTRALYDALRLHPQLDGPAKEERFFSTKYTKYLAKYLSYGKSLSKYLMSFPTRPLGGFLIEKSPDYIIDPKVPSRVIEAAKLADRNVHDLTFIVITRDPIDRAMSEYLEWKIQRKIKKGPLLLPFDEMAVKESTIQTQQPFINGSCYAHHIRNWLQTFGESQICYVDGDKFVKDPLEQIHKLERCMGLEYYFTSNNFVYDNKRGFYCFQKDTLKCLGGSKGRKHPDIAPDVRTRLSQYFQQCNEGLTHFTGS